MPDQRRGFTVTAIGVVHRPGWSDDATTAQDEYFDPFAESIVEIYPEWAAGLAGQGNCIMKPVEWGGGSGDTAGIDPPRFAEEPRRGPVGRLRLP